MSELWRPGSRTHRGEFVPHAEAMASVGQPAPAAVIPKGEAMTDARDRLAQVLKELSDVIHATVLARDAADAIAAFVEERIGERDARVFERLREVESDDMATAKALDALTQRVEDVERETRVLREVTGVEMNRTEEGTRWWVNVQPAPTPESSGGLSGTHYDTPAPTFPSEKAIRWLAELMANESGGAFGYVRYEDKARKWLLRLYAIDRPTIERAAYERGARELAKYVADECMDGNIIDWVVLFLKEGKP